MTTQQLPIVYSIRGCDACVKLQRKWDAEGVQYEMRYAEDSQELMDEARRYGNVVPIILWPDGRVEEGFEGGIGCYIG
ncbi:MAG: hypothetical protein HY532_07995 [Chloroflexi bacterium]|nr:hypothetical protein [Chloroflexota bacterium]